jgi:hypothetical protein
VVTDDESLTRLSTIRILKNITKKLQIKTNIIEASDGLETIFLIYKAITLGIKISFIISDENMNFLNGAKSSAILKDIYDKKKIKDIPFYLLTANNNNYSSKYLKDNNIISIINKPLEIDIAEKLLKKC